MAKSNIKSHLCYTSIISYNLQALANKPTGKAEDLGEKITPPVILLLSWRLSYEDVCQ